MEQKWSVPTRFDLAPYKTIWCNGNTGESCDLYVQMSQSGQMDWQRVGSVLERYFKDRLICKPHLLDQYL